VPTPASSYHFGPFVLDPAAYRLLKGTTPLDLSPKALDLLLLLVRQPGRLVTKDDILAAVWPDVAVTDNALTQVISDLRQALGDSAADPTFIETVPRRGYRFIAEVGEQGPPHPAPAFASGFGAAGPEDPAPGSPQGPRGPAIAVAGFGNLTGDSGVAWLSAGIAETVTNDLRAIRELRVMDRVPGVHAGPDGAIEAARAVGLDLVVVGSYQRSGAQLRITASVLDVRTRAVRAQAKADGALADVFTLQDAIVTQLSAGLQLAISTAAAARITARETSSLDAYRALTEGRLKLEMLDPAEVPPAIAAFERALALDARYALAHVGLAHARFWQFQATRARSRPDTAALVAAASHAKQAIDLDPDMAEAHSALGFFLASAERREEGVAAARRAVALEPGNWRHQFRLGMAAWGEERLSWLDAVTAQYPALAYAYLGRAMVHVARGALDRAEQVLRAGVANERRAAVGAERFPASGLHGLLGLVRLAQGDAPGARVAFDRELQSPGSRLFAEEYARDAWTGHGFALLSGRDAKGAAEMFERALETAADHPRALIGLAAACRDLGAIDRAMALAAHVKQVIQDLRAGGRPSEAAMVTAAGFAVAGQLGEAMTLLGELLGTAPPGSTGWTIPLEPAFAPLGREPAWPGLLARLAERAR
jgi:DNA-binding winged helix-turn-helix (wHTH) protein/tetratricopeptide (TPR) repeat protein